MSVTFPPLSVLTTLAAEICLREPAGAGRQERLSARRRAVQEMRLGEAGGEVRGEIRGAHRRRPPAARPVQGTGAAGGVVAL